MSWDPVEAKFYPLIDDIAPLGFEEVMIDVGWWQGGEPDSDPVDWPSRDEKGGGLRAREGHAVRAVLDRQRRHGHAPRAERSARNGSSGCSPKYGADMWRSDNTSGAVIESSYSSVKGFYDLVDRLQREIPNFQWENCSSGGRIKDHGAMKRSVKIFMSDGFSVLHVRQTFYDGLVCLPSRSAHGPSGRSSMGRHVGRTDRGAPPA